MRFKIRHLLTAGVVYLYVFGVLFGISFIVAAIALAYTVACMWAVHQMILGAEQRRTGKTIEFAQSNAADALGSEWGSFHHVFRSKEPVIESYRSKLGDALKDRLASPELQEIAFKDVDRNLGAPETRTFLYTTATETSRKTGFTLLCSFTRIADIQGVRWWILLGGQKDPNKVFWRYVLAPLSAPFVLYPYARRQYDPLSGLTTIYPGFFNGIDVLNRARELQFLAFETLVEVLDSFGVDTSDLKQQRANVLNINVSGGKTSFGSVVQGAMNKVQGAVTGATK